MSSIVTHEPDHSHLLERLLPEAAGGPAALARLGAVVVPTSRPWADTLPMLLAAACLAKELGAVLVVVCSQRADIATFPEVLRRAQVPVVVIDAHDVRWAWLLPDLETSHHPLSRQWPWDVPLKRNIGLLVATALGWRYVLFLDDDIAVGADDGVTGEDVRRGLAALESTPQLRVVGWNAARFPDNSVVCHARRLAGLPQTSFLGGGALLARVDPDVPFFPQVYNEDWLFFLGALRRDETLGHIGSVAQESYLPFRAPRAEAEERGDLLAESLFAAMKDGPAAMARHAASTTFWADAAAARLRMIDDVRRRVSGVLRTAGPYEDAVNVVHGYRLGPRQVRAHTRLQAIEALDAAEQRLGTSTTTFDIAGGAVDFVSAWRADLRRWERRLERLSPDAVRSLLGSDACSRANTAARTSLGLEPATSHLWTGRDSSALVLRAPRRPVPARRRGGLVLAGA